MAFDRSNLGLADSGMNSNLPRMWSYTTSDSSATVDSAGYFNDAKSFLKVGDVIRAKTSTGGTTETLDYFVSQNDGTTVDVNDGVDPAGTTDTD